MRLAKCRRCPSGAKFRNILPILSARRTCPDALLRAWQSRTPHGGAEMFPKSVPRRPRFPLPDVGTDRMAGTGRCRSILIDSPRGADFEKTSSTLDFSSLQTVGVRKNGVTHRASRDTPWCVRHPQGTLILRDFAANTDAPWCVPTRRVRHLRRWTAFFWRTTIIANAIFF